MDPHQKSLEELIQRELSKLPDRPAPGALIPRVLAEIHTRQSKRWWQRPWTEWPLALRIVSLPFLVASAGGTVVVVLMISKLMLASLAAVRLTETLGIASSLWDVVGALGNALLVLSRAPGQPWLLMGLSISLAMYLTCVGLGTLCCRLAFQSRRRCHE